MVRSTTSLVRMRSLHQSVLASREYRSKKTRAVRRKVLTKSKNKRRAAPKKKLRLKIRPKSLPLEFKKFLAQRIKSHLGGRRKTQTMKNLTLQGLIQKTAASLKQAQMQHQICKRKSLSFSNKRYNYWLKQNRNKRKLKKPNNC